MNLSQIQVTTLFDGFSDLKLLQEGKKIPLKSNYGYDKKVITDENNNLSMIENLSMINSINLTEKAKIKLKQIYENKNKNKKKKGK